MAIPAAHQLSTPINTEKIIRIPSGVAGSSLRSCSHGRADNIPTLDIQKRNAYWSSCPRRSTATITSDLSRCSAITVSVLVSDRSSLPRASGGHSRSSANTNQGSDVSIWSNSTRSVLNLA